MEKAQHSLNAVAGLKNRLKSYMEERGTTTLQGERWKAVIQKNGGKPPLTLLVDPEKLPHEWVRVRREPDTDAIRAALAAGPRPDLDNLARLEPAGTHLRFR